MGRAPRRDEPGAWHHVMHRGAGRRLVFRDDDERRVFLALLAELDHRFGLEVHAYCLMGNHFHLLVRSRDASLSCAMQWLLSTFTKAVNRRRGVDGPIFRGRFHSVLVEVDAHLEWLFRYINANPRDLGWSQPLVRYPWSGLAGSAGRVSVPWLHTDYVRSRFGEHPERLLHFVDPRNGSDLDMDATAAPCDLATVAAAAEIAIAPGPDVHSRADLRRVVSVVGTDFARCHLAEVFPFDRNLLSQQRQLDAARRLVDTRPDLERFRRRVVDLLRSGLARVEIEGERRLTPLAG